MKRIMFITGTRADFGKLKPLIRAVADSKLYEWTIFATGMHMLSRYGFTVDEIYKAGFKNVYAYMNQVYGEPMEMVTANTISGLSRYAQEYSPDLIIVHGDRVEALAGAIVGALRNILVAHIEGGELSGTVDEIIRHSVTKMSHLHFVANEDAARRLVQLGEDPSSIFIIGSPDIDVMLSPDLPNLMIVKDYYQIDFENYAIVTLHPVTTELKTQEQNATEMVDALIASKRDYVVIYPNNDEGCDKIFSSYEKLNNNPHFRIFPSLRFEYFLTLLKNADFIIGNSSAGIREAPYYAIPTINIGSRQKGRFNGESIINIDFNKNSILEAINKTDQMIWLKPNKYFGNGRSTQCFIEALALERLWMTSKQKRFLEMIT